MVLLQIIPLFPGKKNCLCNVTNGDILRRRIGGGKHSTYFIFLASLHSMSHKTHYSEKKMTWKHKFLANIHESTEIALLMRT